MNIYSYCLKVKGRKNLRGHILANDHQEANSKIASQPENIGVELDLTILEPKNQLLAVKRYVINLLATNEFIQQNGLWVFTDKWANDISFYTYQKSEKLVIQYQYDQHIWTKTCLTKLWLNEACQEIKLETKDMEINPLCKN